MEQVIDSKKLWKISKYIEKEAFLIGQLESAGSNTNKILEKIQKNPKYLNQIKILMNGMTMLYSFIAVIMPVVIIKKVEWMLSQNYDLSWIVFLTSFFFTLFFLSQVALLVVFQIFFSAGLFNEELYSWLQTLPISKENIGKIIMFALIRGIRWVFGASLIVYPIVFGIVTKSIIIFLITIMIYMINLVFSFSILIYLSEKFNNLFQFKNDSKKENIIRMLSFLSFIGVIMAVMLLIQLILPKLEVYFSKPPSPHTDIFNEIFPLIPIFNSGYIMNLTHLSTIEGASLNDNELVKNTLIGLFITILLAVRSYKNTMKKCRNAFYDQNRETIAQKIISVDEIQAKILTPIEAFFQKDKDNVKRDMQMIVFFFVPILYGIIAAFVFVGESEEDLTVMTLFYSMIGCAILTIGLMNVNNTGSSIMASLPICVRDQAKSVIKWNIYVNYPSYLIPSFISLIISKDPDIVAILLKNFIFVTIGVIVGVFALCFKSRLFGKLKYKYVLEDVQIDNKVAKWVIFSIIGIIVLILINVIAVIFDGKGQFKFFIYIILFTIGFGLGMYVIFDKMFPKLKIKQ